MKGAEVLLVASLGVFISLGFLQKSPERLLFARATEGQETASGSKKEVQSASEFAKTLPRWDLGRHFPYTSIEDEALDEELEEIETRAKTFMQTYKGHLHERLYEAIREYEQIEEALGQGSCYAYLVESTRKTDPAVVKRKSLLSSKQSRISADYLTFFDLEVAELDEKSLDEQLRRHHGLRHYRPYIDLTRKRRSHLLSEEVERALNVRRPWSSSAPVVEYYQQRIAESRFKMPGDEEEINLELLLTRTLSGNPQTRRLALRAVNEGLKTNAITNFAVLSLNVVAGAWHIEMKERKYSSLRSRRNEANNVPDEVVDALLEAVRTTGVGLGKKYYQLKKAILKKVSGIREFTWADRNAPLGLESDDRLFSFEEAQKIVEEGYRKFSPTMAEMFLRFVEEKRIDMPAVQGKRTGAFCHSCTTKLGPFQCLNYTGHRRDVETLAHESGHACHAVLASPQGYLQFHPPLTQAETASTFGEMIVFRDLLAKSPNDEQRLSMLMAKLDSIVNTVVRQSSFDFFEELVHIARANGTLGDDEFPKLWMFATKRYYGEEGEVFDKYEDMENLWSYVTHFHKVPFYVYAYAFADLIVGSLYSVYKKHPHGFEKKLLKLLADGATVDFVTALKPFDLDPRTSHFWREALDAHLGSLLREAEEVATRLGYVFATASS